MSDGLRSREGRASGRSLWRMSGPFLGQTRRTQRCPETPRLSDMLAVVTGATSGIGVEIARGLARRGADLILPCRDPAKGARIGDAIRAEAGVAVSVVKAELSDLDSVRKGAEAIEARAAGRRVDILVENAGIWPQHHATTRQGHEIAFGVNVLSHFVLRQHLQRKGLLRDGRVVVVTGDIYVLASDCTPDFAWEGRRGGMQAYCRSKLGNLWIAGELGRQSPELTVLAVHPGVVATNLGGRLGAVGDFLRRRVMISPDLGAQTPLVCATQDGLENGGYYHNTSGLLRITPRDPAHSAESAARLWKTCEELAAS